MLFGPKRKIITTILRVRERLNYPESGVLGPTYEQVKLITLDIPSDLKEHVPHMLDTISTSSHSTPLVNAVATMQRIASENELQRELIRTKREFYRALASTGRIPPETLGL